MTLVSGGIRFMRIFAEVPWGGDVTRQCGCQQRQFSAISQAILGTLEMRPALLYGDMQSVVGFLVIPKWVTLNGYFVLIFVFAPVWLAETVRLPKVIAWKLKIDTHCQRCKSSAGTLVSGNIRLCALCSVWFYRKNTSKTVGSRVNARLEYLFLDFENNCVKWNTDRPTL